MNQDTSKCRVFAERLISIAEIGAKSSASKKPAALDIFELLRPSFVQIVGNLGLSAVLSRALRIASEKIVWLREVVVKPDGSLEGLGELEAKVDRNEIAEGQGVLLAEFFRLLVELIGERLVLQLVQQAIPSLSKEDLYFREGNEDEKK